MDMKRVFFSFHFYSSFEETRTVGDSLVQLLHIVPVGRKHGDTVSKHVTVLCKEYRNISVIPVSGSESWWRFNM